LSQADEHIINNKTSEHFGRCQKLL